MKKLKYAIGTALLGVGLLFFVGCGHKEQTFTIKIFVDGSDVVKASGNRLWIEHESASLPGKTIYVNGQAWSPLWNDRTNKTSTEFAGLNPAFRPHDPQKIQVTKRAGRGPVSIETFPSSDNDQTLSIKIDDDDPPGADWYDVQVSW
jgi:hypothetical protein